MSEPNTPSSRDEAIALAWAKLDAAGTHLSAHTEAGIQETLHCCDEANALLAPFECGPDEKWIHCLGWVFVLRGNALLGQNTAETLTAAVASYDKAIELMEALPIAQSHEYRNDLAKAWMGRGNALQRQNTAETLTAAVASYDKAIELRKALPIAQSHQYRNDLAKAWLNRGNALLGQNTAETLTAAVASYDKAIELMEALPIAQSHEYRNDLAAAWMNRGSALQRQNTAETLTAAVASYDKAIELMEALPIAQSHEYRNDLAAAWMNRGSALQRQNTAETLTAAVASYDKAIELRKALPIDQSHEYRNDLAGAWMGRGNALQRQNTAETLTAAVASYDAAIELRKALPIAQSHEYRNDLAAAWMNRGSALLGQNTAETLTAAVASYDKAIELMEALPIAQSHEYRNDLAAAWMNRGSALQRQNTAETLTAAVASYDKAIELMEALPIAQSHEYRNDLAAAWMNRGNALLGQNTAESLRDAANSQLEARSLVQKLEQDFLPSLEVALGCRAGFCETQTRRALLTAAGRGAEPPDWDQAEELADEGLALARAYEGAGCSFLHGGLARMFAAALNVYFAHQPYFVVEVIRENLDPETADVPLLGIDDCVAAAESTLFLAAHYFEGELRQGPFDQRQQTAEQLDAVKAAQVWLDRLRRSHYTETPAWLRKRAVFLERLGRAAEAQRLWQEYARRQPGAVEAHLGLAECLRGQGQLLAAARVGRAAWRTLAESFVIETEQDGERLREAAFRLARHLSDLRLLEATPDTPRPYVEALFTQADQELEAVKADLAALSPVNASPAGVRALAAGLTQARAALAVQRQSWSQAREEELVAKLAESRARAERFLDEFLQHTIAGLERRFAVVAQALRGAREQILGAFREHLAGEPAAGAAERWPEQLAEAFQRAVREFLPQASLAEDPALTERVRARFGPDYFARLPEIEQKYLVWAERLAEVEELRPFAGAAYGLTLESELGGWIFYPLKEQRSVEERLKGKNRLPFAADDKLEEALSGFLSAGGKLMLGFMIAGFDKSVWKPPAQPSVVYGMIRQWVERRFPGAETLLALPAPATRGYVACMKRVCDVRNSSAHPLSPGHAPVTVDDLRASRDALIGEAGFLRPYLDARCPLAPGGPA